ncbi:MAG TPA: alpha-amylase family glycosyl hydrolase [Flavisolibacter sp.]|jgi:glycosidase|nr:alpha-amylase family glycosyl hydrolase [Flavisolibacter sp.]
MQKLFFPLLAASFFFAACNNTATSNAAADSTTSDSVTMIDGHPGWIQQGNIYEVNVRQYTPEGTFKAFGQHLQRLKDMGVQTLWFMPIQPIGKEGRKGVLGSYYAISDYRSVNPEFGTMQDWKDLVAQVHSMGMKVIIDWVPNHTAPDHPWVKQHPEFFIRDSSGTPVHQPGTDWTDTRKLDFKNRQLWDSTLNIMKYWVTETGIDGFRCDHAQGQGQEFWTRANAELKGLKPGLLMLAEAEDPWVYKAGFDMSYAWKFFHKMVDVAAGRRPANSLDSVLREADTTFKDPGALFLHFTSNHDENSWNKADYGTMPGASHAPFAVITQTIKQSVPLIYSGQEVPVLDSISFFYKDTISFNQLGRAPFYKTLLNLRRSNAALAANASFKKLRTSNDAAIYAFEREKDGNKVLVVTNLTNKAQQFSWFDQPSEKEWDNLFLQNREPVLTSIEPWGYAVYQKK